MTVYLFDMDGTLTPPRLPMTEDFADTFVPWLAHHKAFIATGSDFAKVMEQLPDSVINAFSGIYCAMGNQLRQGHEIVYQKDFRKLFKSTLNNRLHRNLACVIDKRSRGAKLKRAFEELPLSFQMICVKIWSVSGR